MPALVLTTMVVLSSETARSFLEATFAEGAAIFHDNMFKILVTLGVMVVVSLVLMWRSNARTDFNAAPSLLAINQNVDDVKHKAAEYTAAHAVAGGSQAERKEKGVLLVNHYYDLSTDLYEFGWGESFHFAPRHKNETFNESIVRHELFLASRLNLRPGMRVLDIGCGVGGPARNIARFTGATIVGVNNNAYQIRRGDAKNKAQGLEDLVSFVKGDFMKLDETIEPKSADAVYAVEATCHAPDRTACYAQIHKTLKDGGMFAAFEWAMTDTYDPKNPEHVALKEGIEVGNSLPDVTSIASVRKSLEDAGFEVLELRDLAEDDGRPHQKWYQPFEPAYTPSGLKTTQVGITMTNYLVRLLEAVRLAPKGSHQMHKNLATGARTLHEAGKAGIFTPMLFFEARKV